MLFNNKTLRDSLCVIMLTHNRPEYVEKSIESLYMKAGINFDLYVFDDCSDKTTKRILDRLRKKHSFKLTYFEDRLNVAKNFCTAILNVPEDYKYYIKYDSDIELLTQDALKQVLDVFPISIKKINKVSGASPRIEGVFNYERYPEEVEFYKGHAIRYRTSVGFGCTMFFTNEVFKQFKKYSKDFVGIESDMKWGIDSKLYETILSYGTFIIVEDVSVYHIDNSFGQRKNFDYFTNRKRWDIIDYEDVWYLKASSILYPKFFTREEYNTIKKISPDFSSFIKNCKEYTEHKAKIDMLAKEKDEETKKEGEHKKIEPIIMKKVFRITSPANFNRDPNIEHGTYKYFSEVPKWAINNIRVVVEIVECNALDEEVSQALKEESKDKKTIKMKDTKIETNLKAQNDRSGTTREGRSSL